MAYYSDRPNSGGPRIRRDVRTPTSPDSGLTVLPPEDGIPREDSLASVSGSGQTSSRRSTPRTSNNGYSRTPGRTPTPTKQVSLQAARRKESDDFDTDPIDWKKHERLEYARLQSNNRSNSRSDSSNSKHRSMDRKSSPHREKSDSLHRYNRSSASNNSAAEEMLRKCYKTDDVSDLMEKMNFTDTKADRDGVRSNTESSAQSDEGAVGGQQGAGRTHASSSHSRGGDIDDSDEFDTDLEDGENEEKEEEEEEKTKAPNELFMEFLDCIMKQEWKTAQNLCRMILLYEPDHPEAKEFQSTIEEKIRLEEELAGMSSDDDDDGSDGDSEGDEEDDSDSDDSGGSDESDDDSDNANDDDAERHPPENDDTTSVADSGIASVW